MTARIISIVMLAILGARWGAFGRPQPPPQPTSGPGGSAYQHEHVMQSKVGKGREQFWVFEPCGPRPKMAPLIVFLHGWGGMNPVNYRFWIHHLVRRGNIVVYPRYQAGLAEEPQNMTPSALRAVRRAIRLLDGKDHVKADPERFALVGHSLGGVISANLAARASKAGLPRPGALMVVEPGDTGGRRGRRGKRMESILQEYETIPNDLLLLVISGEEDRVVKPGTARRIFYATPQIPLENRDFITVRSDRHGNPPLAADHFSPLARRSEYGETGARSLHWFFHILRFGRARHTTNALDFYGYWKLLDGLTDAAFYGRNRTFALGGTANQTFMGVWSDGTPVRPLTVTDSP